MRKHDLSLRMMNDDTIKIKQWKRVVRRNRVEKIDDPSVEERLQMITGDCWGV